LKRFYTIRTTSQKKKIIKNQIEKKKTKDFTQLIRNNIRIHSKKKITHFSFILNITSHVNFSLLSTIVDLETTLLHKYRLAGSLYTQLASMHVDSKSIQKKYLYSKSHIDKRHLRGLQVKDSAFMGRFYILRLYILFLKIFFYLDIYKNNIFILNF